MQFSGIIFQNPATNPTIFRTGATLAWSFLSAVLPEEVEELLAWLPVPPLGNAASP
jgi:hypothetical protein